MEFITGPSQILAPFQRFPIKDISPKQRTIKQEHLLGRKWTNKEYKCPPALAELISKGRNSRVPSPDYENKSGRSKSLKIKISNKPPMIRFVSRRWNQDINLGDGTVSK